MEYSDNYVGKLLDNRYEILEKIGSGGMAVVYKARCHRLNRLVAVKILRQDFVQDEELRHRFQAEAQAVAMLSSPNIVSVYDVGTTGNVDYIVMELIDGITLKQYITRKGVLSWKEALHFSTQIAKALSHAHSRGIIHRDIKPHNIMILRDGSVKVADFGIACLLSTQNTLTQQALGSVHYISPEQAQGGHVDARTDIYSLGVVMYEMLTGRLPFEGESAVSVAIQHISSIPLSPREINPDIPEGLEMITMKAMEPNLSLRYENIDDMLYDLEEFRKNPNMVLNREGISPSVGAAASASYEREPQQRPSKRENKPERRTRNAPDKRAAAANGDEPEDAAANKKMAIVIGVSLVAIITVIGVLMWQFFLKDMFSSPTVPVTIDNFVGQMIEDVRSNPDYEEKYTFEIVTEPSEEEEGYILAQDPAADQPYEVPEGSTEKIQVKLTVSEGTDPVPMPNIMNKDYREAQYELENLQLDLDIQVTEAPSDDVKAGLVIDQYPEAGDALIKGGTVFITYSSGPEVELVSVPSVTGIKESQAKLRLDSANLSYSIQYVHDDAAEGTVIFQSYASGEQVPLHTEVVLQVSLGPEEQPDPEPEPEPEPDPDPNPDPDPGEGSDTDNNGDTNA